MADIEKDAAPGASSGSPNPNNNYDLNVDENRDSALNKIKTTGAISISPELFEKIYLSPKNVAGGGNLRAILGNPTPL